MPWDAEWHSNRNCQSRKPSKFHPVRAISNQRPHLQPRPPLACPTILFHSCLRTLIYLYQPGFATTESIGNAQQQTGSHLNCLRVDEATDAGVLLLRPRPQLREKRRDAGLSAAAEAPTIGRST
jgi:hypothetical protein